MKKSLLLFLCFALIVSWGSVYSPSKASAASSALLPMGQPVEQVVGGTEVVFFDDDGEALDDGVSEEIPIGFDFDFYGKPFDHVYAATNGYLMFEDPVIEYRSYDSLPLETLDHYIAPYFADYELLPISKVLYKTVGEIGKRKFVIQYTNMAFYDTPTPFGTFQVILYEENNEIQFQYPQLVGYEYLENAFGANALIGIQGPTGIEPRNVTYSQMTKSITEKQAIRFTPSDPNEYVLVSNIDNEFAAYDERVVYEPILLSIDVFPGSSVAVSPVDGSYAASNHTFQWSNAIGATSYRLLIAEDANLERIVQDESGIGQTSFDIIGLDEGTTYYWKVVAVNDAGYLTYSNTYRFKVPFEKVLPLNQPVETLVQGQELDFTDSSTVTFDLPFKVNVYNRDYSQVEIGNDGYLRFNDENYNNEIGQGVFDNQRTVLYATLGEAPNRKIVIQYTNRYLDDVSLGTVQVIFYESNKFIQFQYPLLLAPEIGYTTASTYVVSESTHDDDEYWESSYLGILSEKRAIRFTPNGPTSYVVTKKADYDPMLLVSADYPAPSTIVSPADGSISTSRVQFKWKNTSGAAYYDLLLATDPSFSANSRVKLKPDQYIGSTSHTQSGWKEGVYYWKVVSINAVNDIDHNTGYSYSNTYQFIVPSSNPSTSIVTADVSSITSMTATAGGNVTVYGAATVAERGIVYSKNANPSYSSNTKVAAALGGSGAFTVDLAGLQSNTTYYARAYAISGDYIFYGQDVTFTTLGSHGSPASLSALSLSGIQLVSGNVYSYTASVPNTLSSTAITATVQDADYRSVTANVYNSSDTLVWGPIDLASGVMSSEIPLHVGTNKIEIVVIAIDGSETTYTVNVTRDPPSGDQSVTVNTDTTVNAITSMTATVGGSVITDGIATVAERGIVYSLNANPTINDTKIPADIGGVGAFTVNLVGLQSNKTHHARAYAISEGRVNYGQDVAFSTLGSHASLSALSLSGITLSVSGSVYSYTASVPNKVSSTAVTATVQEADYRSVTANVYNSSDTLVLGPIDLASGVMSSEIPLHVGTNKIEIVVLALDGSGTTYTVTVTRAAAQTTPPPGGDGSGGAPSVVRSKDGKITVPVGRAGEVSLNNEIEITIPANASKKHLELTIEKVLNTQGLLSNREILASSVFEILKNFTENFDKSVTITMLFDPLKLKSGQTVAIFYYDEVKKTWVKVEGGKISKDRISAEVNHFTKFAVLVVDEKTGLPVLEQSTDTTTNPTTEVKFSDIAKHWAEASIKQAVISGIVKGYTDGTFRPNSTVTREEFAVMLMNALKPQGKGAELTFTDNAKIGIWSQIAIAQAVQAGIIKGNKDGSFRPKNEVTRAEMAVMIANALEQPIEENATTSFADDKAIPAWAKGSIAIVQQADIVQGKSGNKFYPQQSTTRAEAVSVILKLLKQLNK
ncbi:S-layer homology domain-containing protein [Cohnella abietis]|uniref:S-layer homology domain-containing protein n=1 Tax=Cohnella abietis TaxID=2507935 RepID=UPI00102EB27D|nr:S-layer homology domain-containing protein [Cohnella abietis]